MNSGSDSYGLFFLLKHIFLDLLLSLSHLRVSLEKLSKLCFIKQNFDSFSKLNVKWERENKTSKNIMCFRRKNRSYGSESEFISPLPGR
jgi:hypothetical protein